MHKNQQTWGQNWIATMGPCSFNQGGQSSAKRLSTCTSTGTRLHIHPPPVPHTSSFPSCSIRTHAAQTQRFSAILSNFEFIHCSRVGWKSKEERLEGRKDGVKEKENNVWISCSFRSFSSIIFATPPSPFLSPQGFYNMYILWMCVWCGWDRECGLVISRSAEWVSF